MAQRGRKGRRAHRAKSPGRKATGSRLETRSRKLASHKNAQKLGNLRVPNDDPETGDSEGRPLDETAFKATVSACVLSKRVEGKRVCKCIPTGVLGVMNSSIILALLSPIITLLFWKKFRHYAKISHKDSSTTLERAMEQLNSAYWVCAICYSIPIFGRLFALLLRRPPAQRFKDAVLFGLTLEQRERVERRARLNGMCCFY